MCFQMSDTNSNSRPPNRDRRNYCALSEFFEPDRMALPMAAVSEDENGPLIRMHPFGCNGPVLGMTFERWRHFSTAVNAAVDAHFATRYSKAPQ